MHVMTRCRFAHLVGAPLLLALGLGPRDVLACSYASPPSVAPDPALVGVDVTPPVLSALRLVGLDRGIPGNGGGCLTHSAFALDADASDDLTPPDELAYRVELLPDEVPFRYEAPIAYMYFVWEEEPTEPLDLELRVRAVDQAGNESEPIDIRVTDRVAGSEGGCGLARRSGAALPAWLGMLAAMSWLRRRRERPVAIAARSAKR
jgi:hypothetical protein